MNALLQDVRHGVRQLINKPGFALVMVATLALGIGVNAAVFSLLDGFLLRPLPFPQAERLGVLLVHMDGTVPSTERSVTSEDDSHDGDTWNWIRDMPSLRIARIDPAETLREE